MIRCIDIRVVLYNNIFLTQLFDVGLSNVIEGQMKGGLQFMLRVSDDLAYRMTGFPEENVQLVLGGKCSIM